MNDDLQAKIEEAVKNPRNLGEMKDADAVGTVGSADCGDMLRMWVKFKEQDGRKVIDRATFQTFGCQTAIAVACVFAGRAVAIYLPFFFLGWMRPAQAVPPRWQHVFVIGNIKGALSIALALGLPRDTPFRSLLVDVAFRIG